MDTRIEQGISEPGQVYAITPFNGAASPATCDFFADSGRIGKKGFLKIGDGTLVGAVIVEISTNRAVPTAPFTLQAGDRLDLSGLDIWNIVFTHSGVDSAILFVEL